MTIDEHVTALEKQVVAAKGAAHLTALYARERGKHEIGMGGFLADLAILNRELGAIEGERRVSGARPPAAGPGPTAPTAPTGRPLPPISATALGEMFLRLEGADRLKFFTAHKDSLQSLASGSIAVAGSPGGAAKRQLQVAIAETQSAPEFEPDGSASDQDLVAYHEALIVAGHPRRASHFLEDHRARITRAHEKAARKLD